MAETTYSLAGLPERIAVKIRPDPETGCWLWLGTPRKVDGYGTCRWEGRQYTAHRLVYALLLGSIPEGRVLDHVCFVRICVFPGHLDPVTMEENARRGGARRRRGECMKGHPLRDGNLGVTTAGQRYCRQCHRDSNRRQRARYAIDPVYREKKKQRQNAKRRERMADPAYRARAQQQQNEWRRKRYAADSAYRARRLNRKNIPGRGDTQGSLF